MEVYSKREAPVARWIVAVVLLIVFGGMIFLVYSGYSSYIDVPVSEFVNSLRADWLTSIFKGITFLAEPITLAVLCGVLLIFPKTTLRFGIPITVVTGLGSLIHTGLKHLFMRERPDVIFHLVEETGFGFPSGHSNAGFIFYIFLAFLIGRALKQNNHGDIANLLTVIFSIIVFLIGLSRIYLGVHFPTDVIAGLSLGGLFTIIFISLYDAVYPLKYHLGIQTSEWSSDNIKSWKRPAKKVDTDEKK